VASSHVGVNLAGHRSVGGRDDMGPLPTRYQAMAQNASSIALHAATSCTQYAALYGASLTGAVARAIVVHAFPALTDSAAMFGTVAAVAAVCATGAGTLCCLHAPARRFSR